MTGFETHPHRDMEIVTWVLRSSLIYPGLAQRMSAGTGTVVPDADGITPGYEQLEIDHELMSGRFVMVASGMKAHHDASAIHIKNKGAALHAARLEAGKSVTLPDAPFLHLFMPT